MRRLALSLLFTGALACSAPGATGSAADPTPSPVASSSISIADRDPEPEPGFPGYNSRIPRRPRALASLVVDIDRRLPRAIARWLRDGGRLSRRAKDEVHRGSLLQQRAYRLLAARRSLHRRVGRMLPRSVRRIVSRNVAAQRELSSLVTPLERPPRWKTHRPESPHVLKRYYRKAQARFGVPWHVLASVNAVETRFGRILGPSSAGALGPMQFMPATWETYGRGDIMDPHDSIMAAARYLAASGAPRDLRGALFAYNRSDAYVDAILTYAREIDRDTRNYYMYYFWEVFVRTTRGDLRLTGPGV